MSGRELLDVALRPVAGTRFQPTGFPDLGAARYSRPVGDDEWEDALVVESAQSMANHLEAMAWDRGRQQPVQPFEGLPYVRVVDGNGDYLTSSRTEAHRLASAFIKDAELSGTSMKEVIRERLGLRDDVPIAPRQVAAAVFKLDPMCLVHGVFFAESARVWPGQPKIARALTAFVEAYDVKEAISGGVKRDDVRHTVGDRDAGSATEGYGFVPFHRTEFVARKIVASFCLDLYQLDSYGLPAPARELLATAARWEVRTLLDAGFRPRTACDLVPEDRGEVDARLADQESLSRDLVRLTSECADLFGEERVLEVTWTRAQASRRATRKGGEED